MGINECLMALPKEELVKSIVDIVEKKNCVDNLNIAFSLGYMDKYDNEMQKKQRLIEIFHKIMTQVFECE
jgi:hypothetical protein